MAAVSEEDLLKHKVRARVLAVLVGLALLLLPSFLVEGASSVPLSLDVTLFGLAGAVFGYFWPEGSWRLGLYLVSFWLLSLVTSALFSPAIPINLKRDLGNLLENIVIVIAACLGASLGAFIRRRRAMNLPSG